MPEQQSIKNTLDIIKKALEDKKSTSLENEGNEDNVLILNKIVKEDGTIENLEDTLINKEEIKEILNKKISEVFEKYFDKWLDRNIPNYLDKYFKKK